MGGVLGSKTVTNDYVNLSQSSNDTLSHRLHMRWPSESTKAESRDRRSDRGAAAEGKGLCRGIRGRPISQDAVSLSLGQEILRLPAQWEEGLEAFQLSLPRCESWDRRHGGWHGPQSPRRLR